MRLALALVLLAAACSASEPSPSTVAAGNPTPAQESTTTTAASTPTTTTPPYEGEDVPTLARYLAAIEHGLDGSSLEGAAFAEPRALVETGVLFCALLDQGLSPIDVLRGWVASLAARNETTDDDLLLGGVVLGASVRHLCPDHLAALEL